MIRSLALMTHMKYTGYIHNCSPKNPLVSCLKIKIIPSRLPAVRFVLSVYN